MANMFDDLDEENTTTKKVNMFDDLDEATARQETDEQLADVDRLKTELTDEPLLEPVVNESEAELAAADEAIESTQQTSDGFRQAAACVLQGLV